MAAEDIHCESNCRMDLIERIERICKKIGDPIQKSSIRWFIICLISCMGIIWGITFAVFSNAQKKDDAAVSERLKLIEKNETLSTTNRELISALKVQNANVESWMNFISQQIEELRQELKEHRKLPIN